MKKLKYIASLLFTLTVLLVGLSLFNQGMESLFTFLGTGGITYALVAMASVPKGESLDRAGKATKYRVYVLHYDSEVDLDNVPLPDKTAQTLADITRVSGMYWHYIDAIVHSVIPKFKTDDTGLNADNEVEVKLGGLSTTTRAFLNNYKGEQFFVVWEVCSGTDAGVKYIAGTRCSGMTLSITDGGWTDAITGATIMFKNSCIDLPYKYLGNCTLSTPTAIAADLTTRALVAGANEYQFTQNTAPKNFTAFTGMVAADHGRILTLFGATSTTNATTIDDDDSFLVKDAAIWTANPGARLTVQIFKTGVSTYKFIEISRVTT
jgi:hypothetical protein